jgi:hypothetical protein
VYAEIAPKSELLVFRYHANGVLTFVKGVPVPHGYLICWADVTPNGHFLYLGVTAYNAVAAFDISNPANPRMIQMLKLRDAGNTLNVRVDPSGKYLLALSSALTVPPGYGNELHILSIGGDGRLSEPTLPARIPDGPEASSDGLLLIPHH